MNIYLENFKHLSTPDDMTLAVFEALCSCADGDTLHLGGGELHFRPDMAFTKEYYVSNNDYNLKPIEIPLIGRKNFTVDGDGCRMIFHGKMSPFVVDGCDGITLKNFTVDYAEPMYFEGKIIDSGDDFVEMEYDENLFHCDILDHNFRFYGENWENVTDHVLTLEFDRSYKGPDAYAPTYFASVSATPDTSFLSGMFRYLTASKPSNNKLRLEGDIGYRHKIGNTWLCTHNGRHYPGIFVTESRNVTVENVTLNHTLSMGVICQLTENINLIGVTAVPSEGRTLSVDADATHFVNCSGTIHMKDCRFESMMDDACNIHGIYMPVVKKLSDTRVLLRFGHLQQYGVNIFGPGDEIRFVDNETMAPYAYATVKSAQFMSERNIILETNENLPDNLRENHVIENHTRMPYAHIENCRCGYNRPRGILLTTCKGALVENCTFYDMYQGICMNGDSNDWFESGPCDGIVIRNNNFDNCAYAGSRVITAGPHMIKHGERYHKNITAEGNTFRMHENRMFALSECDGVDIRDNVFVCDESLPSHPEHVPTESEMFQNCDNVNFEPVKEEK